jgi:twitching motility protein PilT
MIDVFPAEQQAQIRVQLAGSLEAIISQRLVPRSGGGMVGAFEVLVATYAARNIIRDGRSNQLRNVIMTGASEGMQTLEMGLTGLVASGLCDHAEAVNHSLHPKEVMARVA